MTRGRSGTILDAEIPAVQPPPKKGRGTPPGGSQPRPPRGPVKPFAFDRLEKVARHQLTLLQRLQWMLPDGLLTGQLSQAVGQRLARVFDDEVRLFVDYVHLSSVRSLKKIMTDPTFVGVLATSPHGARGVIEVELAFAHAIIDTLLGAPSEGGLVRPLTDIEDGVLSYVLIEAFKALSPSTEPDRNRLRLERSLKGLDEALELLGDEAAVAVVEFKALLGLHAGYIRILLPGSSVNAAVPPEDGPMRRARRLKQIEANLKRLAGVRAYLRAEIGHTELTARDLMGLRGGDVLLVDALTVRADQGENGTASLKIGVGRKGHIDASVELVDGTYKARVEQVVLGEEAPQAMPDEEAAEKLSERDGERGEFEGEREDHGNTDPGSELPFDDDEREMTAMAQLPDSIKEDAAELLNDVPLQISVELARIPVTAEEVVSLHVGKVLELGRAPGEPVDLSVNGKVVARGELVEIEGQLGVRILNIAG